MSELNGINQNSKNPRIKTDTNQLVKEFGPKVTSLCRGMIRNEESARDAAQEIWVEILRSLPKFRGESSISTWIYTISKRKIGRFIKDEKIYSTRILSGFFKDQEKEGLSELAEIPVNDRTAWVRLNCSDCINGTLHCLENEARMIYLLRALTPLSYRELSDLFEKEEAAVRKIFSRAARKISRFLSGNCYLYNPDGNCRCKMKGPLSSGLKKKLHIKIEKVSRALKFVRSMDDLTAMERDWIKKN